MGAYRTTRDQTHAPTRGSRWGETWEIKDFVVHRLSSPGSRVGVKLTYRPRAEKTPKETVYLRASDDDGRGYASGRINGLDTEAYFVLLRGKQG